MHNTNQFYLLFEYAIHRRAKPLHNFIHLLLMDANWRRKREGIA